MQREDIVLVSFRNGRHQVSNFVPFTDCPIIPFQDRVLAFGTGRSVTINEDIIEIPLPTESDFVPHSSSAPPVLSPFVRIVRLFSLAGRIADVMVRVVLNSFLSGRLTNLIL